MFSVVAIRDISRGIIEKTTRLFSYKRSGALFGCEFKDCFKANKKKEVAYQEIWQGKVCAFFGVNQVFR